MGGRKTIGVIHNEAFEFLKKNYKTMWLISLVLYGVNMALGMVVAVFEVPLQLFAGVFAPLMAGVSGNGAADQSFAFIGPMVIVICLFSVLMVIVSIVVAVLEYAAYIGGYDATLQSMAGAKPSFGGVWKNFGKNWKRFIGVTAWSMLWQMIWGLLFFVPGIVKSYSYKLAPYLVLQYPDMTIRQALRKSMEMMNGYKGRMFGIDMIIYLYSLASIVGICLFFVGTIAIAVLWVTPMMVLMYSIAYLDIKQAAIERGLLPPSAPAGDAASSL